MINLFLTLLLFANILCYTQIPGYFDNKHVLKGYISPENNMLIFSLNISGNVGLYKYEIDSNSILYRKGKKLELEPFPVNSSETIEDFYFHFNYINSTAINLIIFNEKYLSSYIYNAGSGYSRISIEEIGHNKLAIFYNSLNLAIKNNTIKIGSFDYKNQKFNFTKSYSIEEIKGRANCYCVKTNNNNIVCGIIEPGPLIMTYSSYNYSLILLQEESTIKKLYVHANFGDKSEYIFNGQFKNNFFKLISLKNEKIIYCHYKFYLSSIFGDGIACGLAQVQNNSKIEILIKSQLIFNKMAEPNYLRRNIFSGIKINDEQVILCCVEFNKYDSRNITRLRISNNNTFIKEYKYLNYENYASKNLHNYIQLLKNNDNDIIFLIIYKDVGRFLELGYSFCENTSITLYNGEISKLRFYINPGYFKGYDCG